MRLRDAGYLVGAVLVIGSGILYARASIFQNDRYTEPLVTPLLFVVGTEKTVEVMTKIDANFELVIDVPENQLKVQPAGTDIAWQILEAGNVLARGSSVGQPWQNWWGTYEQKLGTFWGRANRVYTLKLQVNPGMAQLDSGAGPQTTNSA